MYGYKCGICTSNGRMNCHELWSYDDRRHVQKLDGFVALCDGCHHVKHIGLAGILATRGKLDYGEVVEHFMKVNRCSWQAFERHRSDAFALWKERSKFEWKVVVGDYGEDRSKKISEAGARKAGSVQLDLMGKRTNGNRIRSVELSL